MAENNEKLFDQFPEVSYAEWRAKVEADLKGADFDKKLVWRTNEGFNVEPIYRAEDIAGLKTTDSLPGQFPYVRGTRTDNDWLSRQNIVADNAQVANEIALDVLNKGVNSLGYKVSTADDVEVFLKGIYLDAVEINLDCCPGKAVEVAKALVAAVKAAGVAETFRGSINYNPLRRQLLKGFEGFDNEAVVKEACELLDVVADVPGLRCIAVDSEILANGGAFIYQELGYALAWGAAWLTALTEAGRSVDEVAKRIKFNMCVSSNFFMEIAKFRAARMLWAQIVEQYKPECLCAAKMVVNATTSRFNQTIYDAHVNLLRSQTETFSACVAGVDSIVVTPFDVAYKRPDAFSERIARNQQFLLKEESHMDKVVDPAGGSYYVEKLTVSIAEEAWKLFLATVDGENGFFGAVGNGTVQKAVNDSCDKRHSEVARRKEVLLGTNQYPNVNEKADNKIESTGCCCCCDEKGPNALSMKRAATDFEELRLATEASGRRPKVFMLTIGNLAMRLARAQFSTNFFGCAGYEIIDNLGFNTIEEGVDAALAQKADVIVLCSSDDEYAELAPAAFKYLAGRAEFVVAGAPACSEELQAAGIKDFVHVRCNVLDTLRDFNNRLLKK
ncbi:MAG: methylmalonyl-CoA mutase small subunit [Muribaculaceae bacterium]|nr:methylmalonyl-CoA mutase small subunit [Muribaculaceae bacterium]